jgi:hypothetical protein
VNHANQAPVSLFGLICTLHSTNGSHWKAGKV